jgi:histidinol dehydrogenase
MKNKVRKETCKHIKPNGDIALIKIRKGIDTVYVCTICEKEIHVDTEMLEKCNKEVDQAIANLSTIGNDTKTKEELKKLKSGRRSYVINRNFLNKDNKSSDDDK